VTRSTLRLKKSAQCIHLTSRLNQLVLITEKRRNKKSPEGLLLAVLIIEGIWYDFKLHQKPEYQLILFEICRFINRSWFNW
jgi:hypothetical protein